MGRGSAFWVSINDTRHTPWQPVAFIKPAAELDQLAAFTAKGAPALLFAPGYEFFAGRTVDGLAGGGGSVHGMISPR